MPILPMVLINGADGIGTGTTQRQKYKQYKMNLFFLLFLYVTRLEYDYSKLQP